MLYGDRVEGEIDNTGTSSWSFIGIEDDIIDIIVAPNGDLDVVIDVLNENGTSVLDTKVDDSFYEEQIADLALTTSGFFYISVTSYDGTPGSYTLVINKAGASPATSGVTGGNVVRNKVMKGSVTGSEESLWTVAATRGEFLNISVIPTTEEFDVVVDVWDKNGRSLLDRPLDESYDTEYIRTLPVPFDGLYTIVITSFDGSDGEYDLLVEESYHNQPASFIFATDSLGSAEEVHDFFFEAPKGDLVIIHVYPWNWNSTLLFRSTKTLANY